MTTASTNITQNNNNQQTSNIKVRRKFTPQEDERLKFLFFHIGSHNWTTISKYMPGRTPKQCRDRYCNYLSQPHKKEPWSPEEDKIILKMLSLIGPKWVEISKYIPGRSGSNVKNRWYKHLRKINQNEKLLVSLKVSKEKPKDETQNNVVNPLDQYSISSLLI